LFRRGRIAEEAAKAGMLLLLANRDERETENQTNQECKATHNTSQDLGYRFQNGVHELYSVIFHGITLA
jgi:hypothetical protein